MRKSLAVGALTLTLFGLGIAPAAADPPPRPAQPVTPPGLFQSGVDRPDQAPTPTTGRGNRDHSF